MIGHIGQIVRILPDVHSPFAGDFAVISSMEEATQVEAEKYHVLPDGMVLAPSGADYIDSEWFTVDQLVFLSAAEEEEAKHSLPHYDFLRQGYAYYGLVGLGLA